MRAGPFASVQANWLTSLFPHIRRAVEIGRRFDRGMSLESLAVSTLDRLRCGVILVDDALHPRHVNPAAEALLARHGVRVGYRGIELRFDAETERLRALMFRASAGIGGELSGLASATGLKWTAAPLKPDHLSGEIAACGGGVALYVAEDGARTSNWASFVNRHQLTPAEARLVSKLADGLSLQEISVQGGLSVYTLKSQLRACFAKTGTCRQAQLVALVGQRGSEPIDASPTP